MWRKTIFHSNLLDYQRASHFSPVSGRKSLALHSSWRKPLASDEQRWRVSRRVLEDCRGGNKFFQLLAIWLTGNIVQFLQHVARHLPTLANKITNACFFQFWQTGKNSFPQFHHVFRSRISISAAMFFWSQHVWPIHIILTCVCFMLRHIHMHRASLNLVCVCHCASISDDLYCIYYSNMVHMSYTMLFWNCFDLSFFFAPGIVITWLFAGVAMDVHPKKMVVTMWPAKRYKLVCKPMKTTIQQL